MLTRYMAWKHSCRAKLEGKTWET